MILVYSLGILVITMGLGAAHFAGWLLELFRFEAVIDIMTFHSLLAAMTFGCWWVTCRMRTVPA